MEFQNTFVVNAPIDEVWETLMDVERVAGCVPGARVLNQLSDKAYQVAMHVRLGPMSMQYRGQVEVVERNDDAHRAVMLGRAKEAHGQGTADATAELVLTEDDGQTRGSVNSDLRLSGRVAAMGRGVIADVADQIVNQFVGNLEELLTSPAVHERSGDTVAEGVDVAASGTGSGGVQRPPEEATSGTAPVEQVGGDPAMKSGQTVGERGGGTRAGVAPTTPPREAAVSGAVQSLPGARTTDREAAAGGRRGGTASEGTTGAGGEEAAALDGVALVRAVVRGRLEDPNVVLGLLVGVAVVSYLAGRRRRSLRKADLERIAEYLAKRR